MVTMEMGYIDSIPYALKLVLPSIVSSGSILKRKGREQYDALSLSLSRFSPFKGKLDREGKR
jgi:hypothetical protein